MPFLDVSEVLLDPDFCDSFVVLRRRQQVNMYGEVGVSPERIPTFGVICVASPSDLERLDDNDRTERCLSIVTQFRLQATSGPQPMFKPDIIQWCGDNYIVKTVEPYPRYGAGFIQAIVCSTDYQDQPPYGAIRDPSDMDFTAPANAGLIELITEPGFEDLFAPPQPGRLDINFVLNRSALS